MDSVNHSEILWRAFKSGDMDSFHTIYSEQFNHLYEYGMRLINNDELVKDAIHDLFVKLWNNKTNLGDVKVIRSYLLVALRSIIYNRLEKDNRITLHDEVEHIHFEMEFSAETHFIKKEVNKIQTQKLMSALNQLTDRQKEVIYLRYFQEMSYDDIATALNITVKATYKLAARGIDTLKQVMNVPLYIILALLGSF